MPNVLFIPAKRFGDARGWFMEVYSEDRFRALGVETSFVQDNHSLSGPVGTIRGLHFQTPPFAQAKLVRCVRGRIFDVAVDVRKESPTRGHWVGKELSAENGGQLYIPVGFAHGFLTLDPDTEVAYKVSAPYAPANDGGIAWNDPDVAIVWPFPDGVDAPVLSAKDGVLPRLAAFDSPFVYNGVPLSLTEV